MMRDRSGDADSEGVDAGVEGDEDCLLLSDPRTQDIASSFHAAAAKLRSSSSRKRKIQPRNRTKRGENGAGAGASDNQDKSENEIAISKSGSEEEEVSSGSNEASGKNRGAPSSGERQEKAARRTVKLATTLKAIAEFPDHTLQSVIPKFPVPRNATVRCVCCGWCYEPRNVERHVVSQKHLDNMDQRKTSEGMNNAFQLLEVHFYKMCILFLLVSSRTAKDGNFSEDTLTGRGENDCT
jgi:hypothetical protein